MRLATFLYHNTPALGSVREEGIVPVSGLSMMDVIAHGGRLRRLPVEHGHA